MTDVVAALFCENGKFMIAQRPAGKKRELLWEFVGGKVEPGEAPRQALKRECREELAADIDVGPEFIRLVYGYPDVTIQLMLFRAAFKTPPKKLEHADIRWITPAEIPEYDFCPADSEILEKLSCGLPEDWRKHE